MGLRLVELLVSREAAEASQLMIEYDPQPPVDAGSGQGLAGYPSARVGVLSASFVICSR